ncbi:MAG: VCBS repeat-containing protein [Bacteroidetes bacterium]|nr:VCBS repeat-containing protein [Bacteroidota bacterium]
MPMTNRFFQPAKPCGLLLAGLVILLSGIFSCKKDAGNTNGVPSPGEETLTASEPLLKLLSAKETGIDFQNNIAETFENNITTNINISNGGGVAIADINNDGLPDVYFISSTGKNKLFQNMGGMKFKDITDAAGVGSEGGFEINGTVVDINADGYLDFYVCRAGPIENDERRNRLFVNNGDLTFTERAKEYGLDDISASTGANFFDYDGDGDLDLYLLNYPADFSFTNKIDVRPTADKKTVEPNLAPKSPHDTDRLYRNDGPLQNGKGGFKDVSKEAGIWNFAYGLSVSVEDFNGDGWPDVYVGNDFLQPDFLYINNGNGTFTDQLRQYFRHISQHTMGTELADFDNDGLFDLFAVDMLSHSHYRNKTLPATNPQSKYTSLINYGYFEPVVRNVLQRNNGNGTFSDIGCLASVFNTDWSWSGLFADLDNDGLKDLSVTNGYRRELTDIDFINFEFSEIKNKNTPINVQFKDINDFLKLIPTYKIRNFFFQNKGDWKFENMSGKWMTVPASWSNGAAYADLDADGDLDYVVNNIDDDAFVYENLARQQTGNNFLQFKLAGSPQNPMGVGASVSLFYEGQQQYAKMNPTQGIFSSVEHLLHFGLGKVQKVEKVLIRWPDGMAQTLTDVPVNQHITLRYSDAKEKGTPRQGAATLGSPTLFKDQTAASGLDFLHEENEYIDFESYFLLPWKISEQGPLMAAADVNGDGLTDVFIGNSFEKPARLYLQNPNGKFSATSNAAWEATKQYEDHGAHFFDADIDGDPDLFVISGGAEAVAPPNSPSPWQCRLYINMGKGNFVHAPNAIPDMQDVGLRACSFDFDADGDNDLFIGGRIAPGKYPTIPQSHILRNDRNRFAEVTNEVGPEFGQVGMVTDLAWANIDSDPAPELIVTGEWMPLTVFKLTGGKLQKMDAAALGFDKSNGLWNRLAIADLDKDGDLDLVTGNFGLNSRFTASAEAPMLCYANDFDKNGSIDPVMAVYEKDKIYPLVQRDVLIKQMPFLKKRFIYAKDFAKATIPDIFPKKDLDAGLTLRAFTLETCWWENQGGKFVRRSLPTQAQVSPVFGILVGDFNGDGNPDLLMAGNKYGMEVETNRCDAGNGTLLAGDGKGNFTWANNLQSGFWAMKEVRDLALLQAPNGKVKVVVSNNHDKVQVYGN